MDKVMVRTYTDNGVENHLAGQSDCTLCGLDVSGDDEVHYLEPKPNNDLRITCIQCKLLINLVEQYQKLRSRKAKRGES